MNLQIEINKQEAYKILDAIKAYLQDYTITGAVNKTFDNVSKKLKKVIDET